MGQLVMQSMRQSVNKSGCPGSNSHLVSGSVITVLLKRKPPLASVS